jgi:hypothetical protein
MGNSMKKEYHSIKTKGVWENIIILKVLRGKKLLDIDGQTLRKMMGHRDQELWLMDSVKYQAKHLMIVTNRL